MLTIKYSISFFLGCFETFSDWEQRCLLPNRPMCGPQKIVSTMFLLRGSRAREMPNADRCIPDIVQVSEQVCDAFQWVEWGGCIAPDVDPFVYSTQGCCWVGSYWYPSILLCLLRHAYVNATWSVLQTACMATLRQRALDEVWWSPTPLYLLPLLLPHLPGSSR